MTTAHEAINATISEVEKLRKSVAKGTRQISSAAELDIIKANITTWFHTRRAIVSVALTDEPLKAIDQLYRYLLSLTSKAALRTKYLDTLQLLKRALSDLQTLKVVELSKISPPASPDIPPAFDAITSDLEMRKILTNRWKECMGCVQYALPLAAIVMIGGLLEALIIARINRLSDQSPVFKAKAAPKDKAGMTLMLREWALSDYIDVACELKWITETHKDIGVILRDYRNYIHPYKEYQHKKRIEPSDATILWEIGKTMLRQLLQVT